MRWMWTRRGSPFKTPGARLLSALNPMEVLLLISFRNLSPVAVWQHTLGVLGVSTQAEQEGFCQHHPGQRGTNEPVQHCLGTGTACTAAFRAPCCFDFSGLPGRCLQSLCHSVSQERTEHGISNKISVALISAPCPVSR